MDTIRNEKLEALQAVQEYLVKLIPGIKTVVEELKGERKEDTEDFLKQCLEGLNWVIEVYNRTSDIINEKETLIDKEDVNNHILALNEAQNQGDDGKMAHCLEDGVCKFLEDLSKAVQCIA